MFKKLEALEISKHQGLRLSKTQKYAFAKNISSTPLAFSEIPQASQFYPVIFPSDGGCIPTALLSLEKGKNIYIDDQNNWTVPYIPLQFRFYPFVLAKPDSNEDQFTLSIDPDAEHFDNDQGIPLFTDDGKPTEYVQGISKALQVYQKELSDTRALFTDLARKELIVPKKIDVQVKGQPKGIGGFNGVDMEKLVTMDDKMLAGLVKNGGLQMIYNHLQSISKIAFLAQGN